MADNNTIVVKTNGINEVEIGGSSKLATVKVGESKALSVATTPSDSSPLKWIWIATEYLEEAKKMAPEQFFDKWGEWKSKNAKLPVNKFGIGKQYVFANKIKTKSKQKDLSEGRIYYFEPFIDAPTLSNGYYIATVDEPKILSAYFARYKDEFKYPGEKGSSNIYTYKNTLRLYILGHRLPDYTVAYHNFALFEVDIYDAENDKKVTDKPLKFYQRSNPGKFTVNSLTELDLIIDEKWRDSSNHKKDTVKTFYAKVKTTIYNNDDAKTGIEARNAKQYKSSERVSYNPNSKNGNIFQSVAPNAEIIAVAMEKEDFDNTEHWFWGHDARKEKTHASKYTSKALSGEYNTKEGTVIKGQEVTFQVKYNTMDVILEKYEANKSNMLAVVGNTEYTQMNNEPCKYSKLQIEHKSREEPFTIFDENATTKKVTDNTNLAFGIVAGDKKESVKIKALGLAIQSYQDKGLDKPKCYGITMAKKIRKSEFVAKPVKHRNDDSFTHNKIEDVFQMEYAHVLFPERIGNPNASKQESSGDEIIDITSQNLDYTHEGNSIELKLGYLYNKNYDSRVLNFLAHKTDGYLKGNDIYESIKNVWVFRYLLKVIKGEKLHQSYFVPVGTCRYPNQRISLDIYPDIKWAFNLNYNIKDPLYYENTKGMLDYYNKAQSKGEPFPLLSEDASGNIRKKRDAALKKAITSELTGQLKEHTTQFTFHFECEVNGGSKVKIGKDFAERIRKMIGPLVWIKNKLDSDLGVSDAKAEEAKLKRSGKNGLMARLNKLPMSFELTAPNIGVGVGIGYGETQGHQVGYELEGRLIMNPIIGANVTLDVLALGSKFKPWGAIIDALDIAAWLLKFCSDGKAQVNYKINIVFGAKIKLVGTGSKDGATVPAELTYNFANQKYAGNIALQGVIEGKIEASLEMIVEVEKESKRSFDSSIKSKQEREKAFEMGVGIEASSYVSLTLGKNFGEKNNFSSDFYFSGINLKVWIKAGFNKGDDKPKALKIIPDFNKSFDILKNKGEYK